MEKIVEQEKKSKTDRMEKEPVGRLLFSLALPTVLAQLVNLLYNIVDRIYVGRMGEEGALALAGLGVTFPVIMLISAFAALIGMGGAPRASIAMGKRDKEQAEKILGNCVLMLFLVSIVLTVVFMVFKEWILIRFGASENTLSYAAEYLSVYLLGTVFVQAALGLNMFITSQGFAKVGMMTVCIGAILNIVLDPVFIYGLDMGVKGAALATVISQGVSAVWVVKFLSGRKTILKIRRKNFRLSGNIVLSVLALGISPFVMQSTECLVQLTFNTSMLKYGDDIYVAVMSILFSITQFVWLPMQGFTQGAQPILSYNYGAGNMDRVKKTFRLLLTAALTYSLCLVGLIEIFPGFFIRIFSNDLRVIEIGTFGIRIFMAGMLIMGAQSACQQTFLALGEAKISLFLALLRKVILLIPLALVLPLVGGLGTTGLYLAEAAADILAVITTMTLFTIRSKALFQK